ncbi:MAG: DegT/DnrJ/EryC1/StrS family aminotransferase [Spirochaetota bacterium]
MKIPFLDLKRQYGMIKDEIDDALERVVSSGIYIGGEEVSSFEKEVAGYVSVKHAVGVSSGTDALLATLMALGVGRDDEVITTPFTFIATAEVISFLGAKPVFVDIDEKTFNIDTERLEKAINKKTKGIIPVHLFGQMAEMEKIKGIAEEHGLWVVEDAAQSIGAMLNGKMACSFGDAGCLSFFPSKNLGGFGDGGLVLTNDERIAFRVRIIKEHGSEKRYHHSVIGINGRLDAIQAAILRVKLRHLEGWIEKRIEHARIYNEGLKGLVSVPETKDGYRHVFNQYCILTDRRDELAKFLNERGIPTAIYYPIPLHLQPVFAYLGYREGHFPVSESVSRQILALPIFPELTTEEQNYIIESIRAFLSFK